MPRIILLHGFNTADGGANTIDRLAPYFQLNGFEVLHEAADYGWTGALLLRLNNAEAVERLLELIRPGDWIAGHSNAGLICRGLVEAGAPLGGLVLIQPALKADTIWPRHLPVLCLYNPKDWVVRWAAPAWAWLASTVMFWKDDHGWGNAGYQGFAQSATNWDTSDGPQPALGHSGIFQSAGTLYYWGTRIVRWVLSRVEGQLQRQAQGKVEPA